MRIGVMGELTDTQREHWQAFLAQSDHGHPEQDPGFADGWRAQGHEVLFAMGWKDDRLSAVALINIEPGPLGAGKASAMSGPVCDDPADMATFLDLLTGHETVRRAGKLTVTPYWIGDEASRLSEALDRAGWMPFEDAELRRTGIHDATGTPDEIAARFNKSARRKLRKSRDLGLEVEWVTDEATARAAFAVHDRHHTDRLGHAPDREAFLSDFRNVYAHGELGALYLLRLDGEILGGGIVHRNKDTVFLRTTFLDDAATARHGNIRLAPLMTQVGLSWGNARGCRYGDENGYIHGLDPTHPLYPVYKYKEEFRPTEVQRMPGRRKVLRPAIVHGATLAERAADRARAGTAALRGVLQPGAAGRAPAHAERAATRLTRALKLPLGLTIGSSTGLIVAMLVD